MAPPAQKGFESLPALVKVLILVGLLGVLGLFYLFVLHQPLLADIEAAKQRHDKLEQKLQDAKDRRQKYLQLKQELANREAIDRRNRRILPEKAEIASFLQDLNRTAELSGLQIELVEPRPEEEQDLYVRIPVSLRLTGRYHQLMKFFYNVGRLERAINMENIVLSEPRREGEELVLDAKVKATTFRRPRGDEGKDKGGGA